jgi:hypothetical protein
MIGAMVLLVFSDGGMPVFIISILCTIVPMLIYVFQKKRGKIRTDIKYGSYEITFNQKYPVKDSY